MEEPRRTIVLSGNVCEDSIKEAINTIIDANEYDEHEARNLVKYNRKPIHMIINTTGGDAYSMFALVSLMKQSKTPIHTYGYGAIMSAGLALFLMGHKRFADKYSMFMYHGITYGQWGTLPNHKVVMDKMEQLDKFYDEIILSNSNLSPARLKDVVERSQNLYLTGEEALAEGLVDELITEGLERKRGA